MKSEPYLEEERLYLEEGGYTLRKRGYTLRRGAGVYTLRRRGYTLRRRGLGGGSSSGTIEHGDFQGVAESMWEAGACSALQCSN